MSKTRSKKPELSSREVSLLQGVLANKTYSQIAYDLGVTHETVKTYAKRVRAKINATSKVQMAVWASKNL